MSIWTDWASRVFFSPSARRRSPQRRSSRFAPRQAGIESLEHRRVLAVTANVAAGILSIAIDDADNVAVTTSGGNIKINGLDPLSGVELASAVVSISLTTTGNYANTIDLTGINQLDFPALVAISLDAGDGSDVYQIDQSGLLAIAVVNVADTGVTGSDSLTLGTTAAGPETIGVSATSVSRSTGAAVGYSGVETLQVDGSAAGDTIAVSSTAAGTATILNAGAGLDIFTAIDLTAIGAAGLTINAGGDGEALTLNTTATGTVGVSAATVQRMGNGPVNYSGLSTLLINGTAGSDNFNVASTNAATATTINAGNLHDFFGPIALTTIGAAGLTINTGDDLELLTLNTTTTGTVDISSISVQRSGNGPLHYSGLLTLIINGTAGADTFNVASTAAMTTTTIFSLGGTDVFGTIDLTTIGALGLNIDAAANGEALTLNTSVAGTVDISAITVQRGGNGPVSSRGFATRLINGTAGADTFNVVSTAAATATSIAAGGGLDLFGAIDVTMIGAAGLTIDAGSNSELLTLNVTTAGTMDISATTVHRSGNGQVTYSGLSNLDINGTAGADTFNVASTHAATATTIDAIGGLDVFGAIDLTTIGAAGLTINTGGDGEALTLNTTVTGTVDVSATTVHRMGNGPVNYSGLATLDINGTAGADTFNVASTAANTATTINAGGGLDVFGPIALTTIGTAGLNINAGGDGESLSLNTTVAGAVNVSNSTVLRSGNGPITYTGLTTLDISGTAGADTFNVASTHAGTVTTINAGGGTDIFGDIALTTIGVAGLTINAGGNGESLTLNVTMAGNVDITNSLVQRIGNGPVNYTGLANLNVNGAAGVDLFNVHSTHAATAYLLNAAAGNDFIILGNAGSLSGILGAMTIHGASHDASLTNTLSAGPVSNTLPVGDTLHFDDLAHGIAANYTFTATTFSRTGTALVTFHTIETFVLDAGAMGDNIDILGTPVGVNLTVNGNGRADTITLFANGANSNVLLYGGPSGDTINVQTVAVDSVVVAKSGTGDDTVNVSSNAPTNSGTLDAIAGALAVDTDSGNDKLVVSDRGQTGLHNSNVEVRKNRIRGFAGMDNDVDIHYVFNGTLELTLIGSNVRSDKFMVRLPSKSGLTMRFDGGGGTKDCVHIEGTGGRDVVHVGTFASTTRPFRLQNIECLQMFGRSGNDVLDNATPVSSLIDGGDGNDTLRGGSAVDVIFGGDGVDYLRGRDGGDYLFADHEFNNRKPRVKNSVAGDEVFGETGVDTIVAVGTDIISAGGNVGDTIIGSALRITTVDWLRARFLTPSGKNVQNAINEALSQPCTK